MEEVTAGSGAVAERAGEGDPVPERDHPHRERRSEQGSREQIAHEESSFGPAEHGFRACGTRAPKEAGLPGASEDGDEGGGCSRPVLEPKPAARVAREQERGDQDRRELQTA